jgi:hypothetical protein
LSAADIPAAVRKLERRIKELSERAQQPYDPDQDSNEARLICNSINATMDDVFGLETADSKDFKASPHWVWANRIGASRRERTDAFIVGIGQARKVVEAAIAD